MKSEKTLLVKAASHNQAGVWTGTLLAASALMLAAQLSGAANNYSSSRP